jgi:hypothetical protein
MLTLLRQLVIAPLDLPSTVTDALYNACPSASFTVPFKLAFCAKETIESNMKLAKTAKVRVIF